LRLPAEPARCRARGGARNTRGRSRYAQAEALSSFWQDLYAIDGRPLPIRASASEPGLREGQGPRRRRAQRAQASAPSTRARAEQAGGGQQKSIQTGDDSTAQETTFEHAADETRVVRRDPDRVRHFVTDLYQRLSDPGSSTTLEERFRVYAGGRQLGEIVRESGSDKTLFFHTDNLGSVDTITDQTGAVTHQTFDPFGAPVAVPSAELTRAGFTGHQHDNDLGLIDMNGRVYDPLAGRFVSADPVTQAPYWSQGINRYSYVFNDPINNTDPSGFFSWSDFGAVAAGAIATAWFPGGALASVAPGLAGGIGASVGTGLATQGGLAAAGMAPGAAQAGAAPRAVATGQVQEGAAKLDTPMMGGPESSSTFAKGGIPIPFTDAATDNFHVNVKQEIDYDGETHGEPSAGFGGPPPQPDAGKPDLTPPPKPNPNESAENYKRAGRALSKSGFKIASRNGLPVAKDVGKGLLRGLKREGSWVPFAVIGGTSVVVGAAATGIIYACTHGTNCEFDLSR
jgi:RHS repeat-associated protein